MVDLAELGLEPDLCFKLQEIGVNTVELVRKRDLVLICRDLELTHKEVDHLYATVHKDSMPQIYSCLELLQRGPKLPYIPTFCESFNALLSDNGVPIGKIIEFCGSPGTGKTQLGMQLAINTQISSKLTASETEAVYIDTQGGFNVQRAQEIAESMIKQMKAQAGESQSHIPTPQDLLSNIHFFRIHTYHELLALITSLPDIIDSYPKICNHLQIRTIIIDTISFHLRTNIRDLLTKSKIIKSILEHLRRLASSNQVAIDCFNESDDDVQRWQNNYTCSRTKMEPAHALSYTALRRREREVIDVFPKYAVRIKPSSNLSLQRSFSIQSGGIRNEEGNLDMIRDQDDTSISLIKLSSEVADVELADSSVLTETSILDEDNEHLSLFENEILQEATQTYAGRKRHFDDIEQAEQEYSDADVLCFASQDYY
ncbi:hypothetical protein NQZ79_g4863 [Umbelopsis isabellina]|nr:hypothetical protein NQZ79_g4863 [Umbelopsis isabellina]